MKTPKLFSFIISIFFVISLISCLEAPIDEGDEVYDNPFDRDSPYYSLDDLTATFSPADGSTDASPVADVVITFNIPVKQDGWIVDIDGTEYTTGSFDASGAILTITPAALFTRDATVSITLSGFISDDAYEVELEDQCTSCTFTIAAAPTASFSPEDGSIDIPPVTNVVITFNEPMNTDNSWSVTADGIVYDKDSSGISWNINEDELTVSPDSAFIRGDNISVILSGFTAQLDNAPLSGSTSFGFAINDSLLPTVAFSPANEAIDVSLDANIILTFSEAMNTDNSWSVTVDGTVYDKNSSDISWNGNELTINPDYSLPRDRDITVNLSGFTASYDNYPLSGNTTATFSTITFPTVTLSPANGSFINTGTQIVITFSESMNTGTLILSGDMASESDGGIWSTDTYTNDTLTVSPTITWTEGINRFLILDCEDNYGNLIPQLNLIYTVDANPPNASFTVTPDWGWPISGYNTFEFDASTSSDDLTPSSELQVRWDWENDGVWDTPYSTTKTNSNTYTVTGTKTINIEVKDNAGLTSTTTKQITLYEYLKWGDYGSGDGQFIQPDYVAVDSSGNVYVTDQGSDRVQKFDSSGNFILKWGVGGTGDGQFQNPHGVAVDSSGNVYVVDSTNCRIQKFDSFGNFNLKWGSYGTGDGQFKYPWGVAVDLSGNVYVTEDNNARVQKFNSSGNFILKWGSYGTGDGQFIGPYYVAVDSSGNVYITDVSNDRVQKFDSSGNFILKWGSYGTGDGQFYYPSGVAVNSSGNVYIVDSYNNRIQKFDSSGNFILKWGVSGTGDGQFLSPDGAAVDLSGNVYIVDWDNYRIHKFGMSP